ncbi:MAG: TetR/AcrR family transcriptional regulator [Marinobacterium sp.]|nr:TetR/AcrR family transcriptional regulator [Marinobacterium sp.]
MNSTRQALIDSMKELLWLRGYDATSPNQVLDHCGAGKGSFYHHFKGKKALAIEAMNERVDEMIDECDAIFTADIPWLKKFETFLLQPRAGIKGCPVGRLAFDPSMADRDLREPITRYFSHLQYRITNELMEAQQDNMIDSFFMAEELAAMIISSIQGGYVQSRALNDAQQIEHSCRGAFALLYVHTTALNESF